MPPEMAISMRHSKLKAEEAALLAGELNKPSWESRNEGIHERVSFEDTIWGFDLAGGAYYKTPLRVTFVKPNSRAEKAGIRPGDKLKRINDIDTSTLTIQEAHEMIVESGIHLKLAVTAPEDEEDSYYCYQDPIEEDGYDSEEERRIEEEKARKRQVHARVSSYWSLQWPWVSKRRIIYRESNCFMVPSKYEEKHRSKFPTQPSLRVPEDIVLDSMKNVKLKSKQNSNENERTELEVNRSHEPVLNGDAKGKPTTNGIAHVKQPKANGNLEEILETDEERTSETSEQLEDKVQEVSEMESDDALEVNNDPLVSSPEPINNGKPEPKDDEVIEELLNGHDEDISEIEDQKVIDSILSDSNSDDGIVDER